MGKLYAGLAALLLILAIGGGIYWKGGHDKELEAAARQAAADRKAELDRANDDRKTKALTDYDLCVRDMRIRRVPVDICGQLRGDSQK